MGGCCCFGWCAVGVCLQGGRASRGESKCKSRQVVAVVVVVVSGCELCVVSGSVVVAVYCGEWLL